MLILFETAAGFALFRCDKPKKLEKVENLQQYFNDVDGLKKLYLFLSFQTHSRRFPQVQKHCRRLQVHQQTHERQSPQISLQVPRKKHRPTITLINPRSR